MSHFHAFHTLLRALYIGSYGSFSWSCCNRRQATPNTSTHQMKWVDQMKVHESMWTVGVTISVVWRHFDRLFLLLFCFLVWSSKSHGLLSPWEALICSLVILEDLPIPQEEKSRKWSDWTRLPFHFHTIVISFLQVTCINVCKELISIYPCYTFASITYLYEFNQTAPNGTFGNSTCIVK